MTGGFNPLVYVCFNLSHKYNLCLLLFVVWFVRANLRSLCCNYSELTW
jgi:hypothetical protein